MAMGIGGHRPPSTAGNAGPDRLGAAILSLRDCESRDEEFVPGLFEATELYDRLVSRLSARLKRGNLAIIEIQNPYIAGVCDGGEAVDFPTKDMRRVLASKISDALGRDDIFCWHEGRFILLFSHEASTRSTLRKIAHSIAKCSYTISSGHVNPTPAIGYLDLRMAKNAQDAEQMAETALDSAKSSLEIEPFRYISRLSARYRPGTLTKSIGLWSKAPQWLAL